MASPRERLPAGLYERIVTDDLATLLSATEGVDVRALGKSEAARVLGRHLGDLITRGLESVHDDSRPADVLRMASVVA